MAACDRCETIWAVEDRHYFFNDNISVRQLCDVCDEWFEALLDYLDNVPDDTITTTQGAFYAMRM